LRVRIIFTLKNKGAFVPFHHQFIIAHQVKGLIISGNNPAYKDYNFYNFSGLKGQTKVSRNGLHFFSNKVTLVFSSPEKDFIDYFIDTLFSLPQLEIGNLVLIPESVELEQIPDLAEVTKFICISPIVIIPPKFNSSESKRFIAPEMDEFSDRLYESTILRMQQLLTIDEQKLASFNKFQLVPDEYYLKKIRENQKKFARIYPLYDQDVKYEVRGYTFPFALYAEPEVKDFIFHCGLGEYAHKGFGMIDIANLDPAQRTKPYKAVKKTTSTSSKSDIPQDDINP